MRDFLAAAVYTTVCNRPFGFTAGLTGSHGSCDLHEFAFTIDRSRQQTLLGCKRLGSPIAMRQTSLLVPHLGLDTRWINLWLNRGEA
jgi:hypothetical protein